MAGIPGPSKDRDQEPPKKRIKLASHPIHDDFEFKNEDGGKSLCKHCGYAVKGKNSSNLQKHLQSHHKTAYKDFEIKHAAAVKEAESSKSKDVSVKPPKTGCKRNMAIQSALGRSAPINSYLEGSAAGKKYSHNDPRQKKINQDIALLVASSTLPVSLTSLPAFKRLIHDCNPHVLVPEQTKVKKEIDELWEKVRDTIEDGIRVARRIALTSDVCTSKGMKHSYLGVTVHFFNPVSKIRSAHKVACREFPNPHTGEAIARMIVDICQEFGMNSKINYILADNGSNMAASYKFMNSDKEKIPSNSDKDEDVDEECEIVDMTDDDPTSNTDLQDQNEEEDTSDDDHDESDGESAERERTEEEEEVESEIVDSEQRDDQVEKVFRRREIKRGRCYSHTQQCAINRVNKQRNVGFGKVLGKCKKFVAKYRKSPKAKGILNNTSFKKSLIGFCKTRWYSDMAMVKSLIEAAEKEDKPLAKLSSEMNWNLQISVSDVKVLKQYGELMEPFAKHTDVLGGENYSTIHLLYPALQDLLSHLNEMSKKYEKSAGVVKYCKSLEKEMKKYFSFVLDPKSVAFDPVYYLATFLDPIYSALLTLEQREIAVEHLKDLMKEHLEEKKEDWHDTFDAVGENTQTTSKSPVFRGFKHVSKMLANVSHTGSSQSTPFARDLEKYSSDCEKLRLQGCQVVQGVEDGSDQGGVEANAVEEEEPMEDPLDYWVANETKYETVLPLIAEDILMVPATSTPSERLFSVSGMLCGGKMSNISPKVWCNMLFYF